MFDFLNNWTQNAQGNYYRTCPYDSKVLWYVYKQIEGWYWCTLLNGVSKLSSDFGPHTSYISAIADCEVAGRS